MSSHHPPVNGVPASRRVVKEVTVPDYTVRRFGTDTSGRAGPRRCLDCKAECEASRCPRCARNHRQRAAHRARTMGYKNPRSAFGRELARTLRSGGDALAVIEDWVTPADSGCWPWPGAINLSGYGQFLSKETRALAHRLVYELAISPIPSGAVVHHRCARRDCVNPEHLQQTSAHANNAEMFSRRALLARIAELEARVAELEARDA